jgi:four helix bundle protein
MVARSFQELDCWQLANELKVSVYLLTDSGPAARDFDFRDQIRESAASAPSNIAEGFGRYKPPQFRQFLDIAIASLYETTNHLRDGVERHHFSSDNIAPLLILAKRAAAASIRLKRYLKTARPPELTQPPRPQR